MTQSADPNIPEPIAIVGIGGCFPGAATLDDFWENILAGKDSSSDVPESRWPVAPERLFDSTVGTVDRVYSLRGCFLGEIPIDAAGLPFNRERLARLDPLFHLALHAGRMAFADARNETIDRARTGVILANVILPTETSAEITRFVLEGAIRERLPDELKNKLNGSHAAEPSGAAPPDPLNRYMAGLPAGLLARALGLGGGSYTLDAACASSLYALKLACDELRAGRADAMIAGGIHRSDCLFTQMGFSQLRALSVSGRSRPLDARADGLVVGEGAGMFVLKRLGDAVRAGDRVYALIRGAGLSNDTGGGLLAPDSEGQLRAMREAYRQAGWKPESVSLVECHATGTPLGDATELKSLKTLWGRGAQPGSCAIGAVKSNVGHLLTAAGSAGVMKLLFALRDRVLPPTANFETPNGALDAGKSPFRVLGAPEPWTEPDDGKPRRAAISAFGFGGINAHLLLEEYLPDTRGTSVKPAALSNGNGSAVREAVVPVAIVGMDARVGPLGSLRAFQEAVLSGKAIASRPAERWRNLEQTSAVAQMPFAERALNGAFIEELDIAPTRFRIPPNELKQMLPQQLVMLETAANALADSVIDSNARLRTGVFIGLGLDMNATNFHLRWRALAESQELANAVNSPLTADRTTGALGGMVASRIAREFHFGGPSFTISGEENSGMRALETATRAIQRGELDCALVGAVDLAGDLRSLWAADSINAISEGGQMPFAPESKAAHAGEGAVALVLKRLDDALAAGDRVYAVVRGVGAASSDAGAGLMPGAAAIQSAMERAYRDADLAPGCAGFLETHGGGVEREGRTEAEAVASFYRAARVEASNQLPCAIGALKPLVGRADAASGLLAVARAALCLYQEMLPPFGAPKALIAEFESAADLFHTPRAPQYWFRNRAEGPRRAAVNSLGLDGNCVHVVLESHEQASDKIEIERRQPLGAREEALFCFEAKSVSRLIDQLRSLKTWVDAERGRCRDSVEALARLRFSKNAPDPKLPIAAALVARTPEELIELANTAAKLIQTHPSQPLDAGPQTGGRIFYQPAPQGHDGALAFVFPGSGNQYVGMGLGAGAEWPEVLRALDLENELLLDQFDPAHFAPWRLTWPDGWESESEKRAREDHRRLIFAHVSHSAFMSDVLRAIGVRPNAAIGYSLGESASYFATRAWTSRDEMVRRMMNSSLFVKDLVGPCEAARKTWELADGETVDWCVLVVDRPAEAVRAAVRKRDRAYLLIVNAPDECVIGGQRSEVMEVVRALGCNYFPLEGVSTVHCEVAMQVQNAYRGLHLFKTSRPAGIRFYSSGYGRFKELGRQHVADSIVAQAIGGIDFPRMIEQAYEDGVRIFIETGPRGSCSRMIGRILEGRPHVARTACVQGQGAVSTLLRLLARLMAERVPVDLRALYGQETRVTAHLIDAHSPKISIRIPLFPDVELPEPPKPSKAHKPRTEARKPAPPPKPLQPELQLDGIGLFGEPAASNHAALETNGKSAATPIANGDLTSGLAAAQQATAEAHEVFLRLSKNLLETQSKALAFEMSLLQAAPAPARTKEAKRVFMDRAACLEFARGKIGSALGPRFSPIDAYPTRVRLPDEPLMLVDRIILVSGEPCSMKRGATITEHDVRNGAWYLDQDRMVAGVSIESGQSDLFLSAYLGIDFATKGLSVYRLLDASVIFHAGLPSPGAVLRYDIRIDRFIRQADTHMFFFQFDGYADGKPFITMRDGCAGFFTEKQLREGRGIVLTEEDKRPSVGLRPDDWRELAPMRRESFDGESLDALRVGDLARCFGHAFAFLPLRDPVCIPGGRLQLIDRVTELDPSGGRFGLGLIRAEIDIHPEDWFLTCHFIDDNVMPGTLMYESCLQALRIFLLRMGWVGESAECHYEPRPGVKAKLRCRGQVIASTKRATYEIAIKEIGYGPEPYAIADAMMYADGAPIVQVFDISLQLTGATRERIEQLWHIEEKVSIPIQRSPVLYSREQILEFCHGKPSRCFGEKYEIFDEERFLARLPSPPFTFIERITQVEGRPLELRAGAIATAEYDVPPEAWYFRANRQPNMPFSVILEAALQVCGWVSAFVGSALSSDKDLHYRNLGGTATLHEELGKDAGTLTTQVELIEVSRSGGMIIQKFTFAMSRAGRVVYEGETLFGFFTRDALAQQIGLRGAAVYEPTAEELARRRDIEIVDLPPFTPDDMALDFGDGSVLPARAYRMIDAIDMFIPDGGPKGLGFIRGTKRVNPDEWFFKAHFYQDPVMPGSLGLEAFIQLLKVVAAHRWGACLSPYCRFEPIAVGVPHTWVYRGQVVPKNKLVTVEAVIDYIDDEQKLIKAGGLLRVDGLNIYEMKSFGLRLKEE